MPLMLHPDSGQLLLAPSGQLAVSADCCCGCTEAFLRLPACTNMADLASRQLLVELLSGGGGFFVEGTYQNCGWRYLEVSERCSLSWELGNGSNKTTQFALFFTDNGTETDVFMNATGWTSDLPECEDHGGGTNLGNIKFWLDTADPDFEDFVCDEVPITTTNIGGEYRLTLLA